RPSTTSTRSSPARSMRSATPSSPTSRLAAWRTGSPEPAVCAQPRWRALADDAVDRGVDRTEVRRILEQVTGADGGAAVLVLDDEAPERLSGRFAAMVERRLAGEPLQYVLGSWGFRRLDL